VRHAGYDAQTEIGDSRRGKAEGRDRDIPCHAAELGLDTMAEWPAAALRDPKTQQRVRRPTSRPSSSRSCDARLVIDGSVGIGVDAHAMEQQEPGHQADHASPVRFEEPAGGHRVRLARRRAFTKNA